MKLKGIKNEGKKVEHYRGVIITSVMVFSVDSRMREKFDNSFKNGESPTREPCLDIENKSFPPFLLWRFAGELSVVKLPFDEYGKICMWQNELLSKNSNNFSLPDGAEQKEKNGKNIPFQTDNDPRFASLVMYDFHLKKSWICCENFFWLLLWNDFDDLELHTWKYVKKVEFKFESSTGKKLNFFSQEIVKKGPDK